MTVLSCQLSLLLTKLYNYEPDIHDQIKGHFIFFKPKDKGELKTAVDCWCHDESEALKKYGPVGRWDVSEIDDMSNLFAESQFNGNISQWDVDNVINMS